MMKKNDIVSPLLRFSTTDVKVHTVTTRYSGFFKLDEYRLSHQQYDGNESAVLSREIFEREDAVVLMPYDPVNDTLVVLEQFRAGAIRSGMQPWLLEFVAGMFEKNESPVDVAVREAQEEAGLKINPQQVTKITEYLSSPGGMSEAIHLYYALVDSTGVGGVHGLPEEGEDILVHVIEREQMMALLAQGKITNAATIIALQWLALNVEHLRP